MNKWAGLLIAVLGIGCGDDGATPLHDGGIDAEIDAGIERVTVLELPAAPIRGLDLLFVIDNSHGMADKQANLVANFPTFIDALASLPGGLPNLHLAVITTDMGTTASESEGAAPDVGVPGAGGCAGTGDGGRFVTNGAAIDGQFLSDVDVGGERVRNYTGTLAEVFSTMAAGGGTGCGFEQPLRAMRTALDGNPVNAGFLREDALLGVVFLTDEDDCSLTTHDLLGPESALLGPLKSFRCTRFGVTCTGGGATPDQMNEIGLKTDCTPSTSSPYLDPVAPYRDFLVELKGGDASRVAVTAIMGYPAPFEVELQSEGGGTPFPALAPSCSYQGALGPEVAHPGVRMQSFLDLFPNRSRWTPICQPDLSGGLALFGELLRGVLGYPCLDPAELADTDPSMLGLQYDCIAEDVLGATVTEIAPCGPGAPATCWSLEASPTVCPGPEQRTLVVTRPSTPPGGTITRLRCVTP